MASGIKIKGMDKVITRLKAGEIYGATAMRIATFQALNVIKFNARLLLMDWYASHPKKSWERERTGSLYKSFRNNIILVTNTDGVGELINTDPAALWVEKGTADHEIPYSNKPFHYFPGPSGPIFTKAQPHEVTGIDAAHFMAEALQMSRPRILQIYATVFSNPEMAAAGMLHFGLSEGVGGESIEENLLV